MAKQITKLRSAKQSRSLVALRRSRIDSHAIQGYIIETTDALTLIQYVRDFTLDGLMVLRTRDITSVKLKSKTDALQHQVLLDDGIDLETIFAPDYPLDSWPELFAFLENDSPMLIIESEYGDDPEFLIGFISEVFDTKLKLWHFTGAARWEDEPTEMRYDRVTCCQLNTTYINGYKRHFDRHPEQMIQLGISQ
ncbi:MAG: hypothetical protein AAF750_01860 [Planctomycetota bacterium]